MIKAFDVMCDEVVTNVRIDKIHLYYDLFVHIADKSHVPNPSIHIKFNVNTINLHYHRLI